MRATGVTPRPSHPRPMTGPPPNARRRTGTPSPTGPPSPTPAPSARRPRPSRPGATFGSPGTATRMISASPSPSATNCTRQRTSPLTSVRGAHASRGLPSSYCRNGSAGATTRNFSRDRVDRKTHWRDLLRRTTCDSKLHSNVPTWNYKSSRWSETVSTGTAEKRANPLARYATSCGSPPSQRTRTGA